jgi:hypothetical protein
MPRYETALDLAHEREIATAVQNAVGCLAIKRPNLNRVDYEFRFNDGKLMSFGEMKWRKHSLRDYGTLIVDVDKLLEGLRESDENGRPFFLFVRFVEGFYWAQITRRLFATFKQRMEGRNDRGDPNDRDLCAHIPVELFRPIQ